MTFRQIQSVTLVSAAFLCACNNETEDSSVENEYVSSVRVTVESFKDGIADFLMCHFLHPSKNY